MAIFQYYHYFFFFLLVGLGAAGSQDDEYCMVSRCADHGPPIRFPFRLKNTPPDRCSYRGFELSCDEKNQTVLELPTSVNMVVKKIDYKSQNIHLCDPDNCLPKQLPNLTLSLSPFVFFHGSTYDFTLFNCSPATRDLQYSIPCLSIRAGYTIYAFANAYSLDSFDFTSCFKTIYNISSVPQEIFDDQKNLVLAWEKPNCTECESNGTICSLKNYNATESAGFEIQCLQSKPAAAKGAWKKLLITEARNGEGRRTGGSCSKWQTAHLAVSIHT